MDLKRFKRINNNSFTYLPPTIWHHSQSCCSLVQADQAAARLFTSTWLDDGGGSGAGAAGGGGMIPSLFRIILQTDGRVNQSAVGNINGVYSNTASDWFLLQRLWSLLHFASFGVNHGTFHVRLDQIRLIENQQTLKIFPASPVKVCQQVCVQ